MLRSLEWLDNGNRVNCPPLFLPLLIPVGFALHGIAKQNHCSLIPPQSPTSGQSIDEFIKKKLSQKRLRQSDEASRRTLIRRVHVDMLGLIPTPEEMEAFVTDERKDAYERLLEKVLEDPVYVERSGQLIQTLDRGDYDQKALFRMLRELGFQGNVGFQYYAIRGDSRENMKRSIDAWNKLHLN